MKSWLHLSSCIVSFGFSAYHSVHSFYGVQNAPSDSDSDSTPYNRLYRTVLRGADNGFFPFLNEQTFNSHLAFRYDFALHFSPNPADITALLCKPDIVHAYHLFGSCTSHAHLRIQGPVYHRYAKTDLVCVSDLAHGGTSSTNTLLSSTSSTIRRKNGTRYATVALFDSPSLPSHFPSFSPFLALRLPSPFSISHFFPHFFLSPLTLHRSFFSFPLSSYFTSSLPVGRPPRIQYSTVQFIQQNIHHLHHNI